MAAESMEEQEPVDRREAVIGLSLLSVLLLALVGTIFYRIMNPLPPTKVSLESLAIAPAPQPGEPPAATASPLASSTEAMQLDGEVSAATFGAEPTGPIPPDVAAPTFVAPTHR
jgi:hypothetical protein